MIEDLHTFTHSSVFSVGIYISSIFEKNIVFRKDLIRDLIKIFYAISDEREKKETDLINRIYT